MKRHGSGDPAAPGCEAEALRQVVQLLMPPRSRLHIWAIALEMGMELPLRAGDPLQVEKSTEVATAKALRTWRIKVRSECYAWLNKSRLGSEPSVELCERHQF